MVAAAIAAALIAATPARADDGGGDDVSAEALFQRGRELMDAKRYGEACPKFAASYGLDPAIGTLLNLADCYEKNGQLASAWARFREAIALAQRLGRPPRERTARARADKLEPRLIRLSILSPAGDLEVKLDGRVLDAATLASPIPVDAGAHTIEASAEGKKTFSVTIEADERSRAPSVELPALEDAAPKARLKEPARIDAPTPPPGEGSAQRTLGVVVAGVGVVGVGVGAFFGVRTSSTWDDAKAHCTGLECDASGVDLAASAKVSGNVSTVAFAAGGALVLGGAILFFTAPQTGAGDGAAPVRVGIGPGSVVLGGRFR